MITTKDAAHEEHEQAWRSYADAIEKAKRSHWEEWLENLGVLLTHLSSPISETTVLPI